MEKTITLRAIAFSNFIGDSYRDLNHWWLIDAAQCGRISSGPVLPTLAAIRQNMPLGSRPR